VAQGRSGGTTVGEFVAFVTALLQLVAPAKHLSDVMAPLTRGLAALERRLSLLRVMLPRCALLRLWRMFSRLLVTLPYLRPCMHACGTERKLSGEDKLPTL
jgi:ABC-type multidrug transport system fused ATPase/permease subunit